MNIMPFKMEKHYEALRGLFEAHKMPTPPPSFLPTVGVMTEELDAAAFLYQTDSAICWIEPLIVSPNVIGMLRTEIIERIVDALEKEAKKKGFSMVYCMTNQPSVMWRAENLGYQKAAENNAVLGKGI